MIQSIHNGKTVITFSDTGHKVMRDGIAYDEAWDPANTNRVYSEAKEYADEPTTAMQWWAEKIDRGEASEEDIPERIKEAMEKLQPENDL